MSAGRVGTVVVLALTAALVGAVAVGTDRLLAAALAAVAVACGLALALRAERYESTMDVLADVGEHALTLAPGALIVYFAFNGGGYFPGSQGFIALLLAIALALRMSLASEPLAGFGPLALVASGLLSLYAVWVALSAQWSHAPGRAVVELDRVILYLLAFLLFASFAGNTERMRLMLRGLVAGVLFVACIGLVTRVAPDVWPIAADLQRGRLSYPLTYWNAFGLLAALGLILSTHLASSESEPALVRVVGAAAMPVIGSALFFTFSRGGWRSRSSASWRTRCLRALAGCWVACSPEAARRRSRLWSPTTRTCWPRTTRPARRRRRRATASRSPSGCARSARDWSASPSCEWMLCSPG